METPNSNKSKGYQNLFKNKNFLYLWLGQVFSQLGDRVTFVVFVALIASNFGTSTSLQSWLYIAFTIPAILLTAIAGVFIDKWNKKYVLITTNILRAGFIALIPFFDTSLLGIYAIAFLISCATQFFVPAEASFIPHLVEKQNLLSANSLFTTTMMGSIIFGFVLGDPLINIFSLNQVHYALICLFLISSACITFVKYKFKKDLEHPKTIKEFIIELKQGFIYIKNHKIILQAILKLTALFSIIIMLSILSISLSQQYLYPEAPLLGSQKFVYIIAFSGVGMVLGSITVGKFGDTAKKYFMIFLGFTIIGLSLVLLPLLKYIDNSMHFYFSGFALKGIHLDPFRLTHRMIYSYIISAFAGFGCAFVAIPVQTVLHKYVNEKVRGKVFGVQFMLLSTASTVPVLIAALGADKIGTLLMLWIIGIPVLIFGLYGLYKNKFFQKEL